jgi:N-acetylneuraminate synthase
MKSISETNNEVFLSTGMSSINEIDLSVKKIKDFGLPLTILQCTSIYPTPPEKIGLNMINYLRNRYECNVGLSDHSGKLYTGLAAASIGIEVLEVHVTFSKEMFGPDVSSSISIDELKLLVEGVRFIENILEHEVDKDAIAEELKPMRKIFRKSVVYLKDMKEGTIIKRQDICFKKPGTGVKPEDLNNVLGRELRRSVSADSLLSLDDLN